MTAPRRPATCPATASQHAPPAVEFGDGAAAVVLSSTVPGPMTVASSLAVRVLLSIGIGIGIGMTVTCLAVTASPPTGTPPHPNCH